MQEFPISTIHRYCKKTQLNIVTWELLLLNKWVRMWLFSLCLMSELCPTSIVTDWTRNSQTPREGDFGSEQDLSHWPPPHDFSSGGDSVYRLSAIPSVSFRYNFFTICRPVPCWYRKCQYQAMVTQTIREYPHQLGCQTLALQDPATDLALPHAISTSSLKLVIRQIIFNS